MLTGLGDTVTLVNVGILVSSVTVRVTLVDLPNASVDVIMIVLAPSESVTVLLNEPSEPTVTLPESVPLTVILTVTGDDNASFVTPLTVTLALFVKLLFVGADTVNVGGTVSILIVIVAVLDAFPSLSDTLAVIVWFPSVSAVEGV